MAEVQTLTATPRDRAGKGSARAVRRDGLVPAVIYGNKLDPLSISIPRRALEVELHKAGFFIRLIDVGNCRLLGFTGGFRIPRVVDVNVNRIEVQRLDGHRRGGERGGAQRDQQIRVQVESVGQRGRLLLRRHRVATFPGAYRRCRLVDLRG